MSRSKSGMEHFVPRRRTLAEKNFQLRTALDLLMIASESFAMGIEDRLPSAMERARAAMRECAP